MKHIWAPWRIKFIEDNRNKMKNCVFCELPKQNQDAKNLIVARSKNAFVILNKYPYNSGHLMIIPFQHTNELSELNSETLLEMQNLLSVSMNILKHVMKPHGFNIGMNLGEAGGAGIKEHLHYHIVPRWNGDTNFMPVFGEIKVLPESLEDTFQKLAPLFKGK